MPSVSRAQQAAMHAAAAGKSTIGIPKKVGQEFADADAERGPKKLPQKAPSRPGMAAARMKALKGY